MADQSRNIRDAVKSFVPNWLSDRLSLRWGFSFIYTVALAADMFVEQLWEGVLAAFPGLGTTTALPLLGRARGLMQGLLESDEDYATRLRAWLDVWPDAGSAEVLLQQIQTFLGDAFVCRLIDRSGNFASIAADGTVTYTIDATWDWDEVGHPERVNFWSDLWIVIYVNDGRWPVYSDLTDPAWLAAWGQLNGPGSGHQVTRDVVDGVNTLVASFKGAHNYLRAIIWTNDDAYFVPGALAGTPDGMFGDWSRNQAGTQIKARTTDNFGTPPHVGKYMRYWIPSKGG